MRSTLLLAALAALAPALLSATPIDPVVAVAPVSPRITSYRISGSGCPNDSGSVKTSSGVLADSATFTFSQLSGDSTDNCEIHVQSAGGSTGWQVAVQAVTYSGDLSLKPGSQLDTYTQIFWSDKAAETSTLSSRITCAGPEIRDSFTLRQSTNDLKFSKCTGDDGNPGILNVNARPVISGNSGVYNVKSAKWDLVWRKC